MYVVLLFSVLHQQINCCFILALANNQNIITKLVAHGGAIFYSAQGTQTHTHTHTLPSHSCMHANASRNLTPPSFHIPHPYLHTHRHPHKARVRCSLMPPVELSLDFVSLRSCIFSGSDERWARLRRSARSERDEIWPASPGSCSLKPRP